MLSRQSDSDKTGNQYCYSEVDHEVRLASAGRFRKPMMQVLLTTKTLPRCRSVTNIALIKHGMILGCHLTLRDRHKAQSRARCGPVRSQSDLFGVTLHLACGNLHGIRLLNHAIIVLMGGPDAHVDSAIIFSVPTRTGSGMSPGVEHVLVSFDKQGR